MIEKETNKTHQAEEITRFWRHVLGGQQGLLLIRSFKEGTVRSEFFKYPENAKEAATHALDMAEEEDREVYFCAPAYRAEQQERERRHGPGIVWRLRRGVAAYRRPGAYCAHRVLT